jgi:hypothetical protein
LGFIAFSPTYGLAADNQNSGLVEAGTNEMQRNTPG